jgi:hypothetical protein
MNSLKPKYTILKSPYPLLSSLAESDVDLPINPMVTPSKRAGGPEGVATGRERGCDADS